MVSLFFWAPKEPAFITELKGAEVENRLRTRLSDLLEKDGETLPKTRSPTEFAIAGTVATVNVLLRRSGRTSEKLGFEERFVVGIFGFLIAHEFGRRTSADLGTTFAVSALELFSPKEISAIYQLGEAYRRLRQHKTMHRALLRAISEWLDDPSEERLDELATIFDLCCKPN